MVSIGTPWQLGPFRAAARAERRSRRRERNASAGAARDTFLDVVVLLSVLMFLALAAGVGMLVLRGTGAM